MSLEPINNTSIQNFQIEYSNKFFQFAINNRIKALENQIEIAYDYTKGSGAGTNFENKIIKTILFSSMSIFGQKNYHEIPLECIEKEKKKIIYMNFMI